MDQKIATLLTELTLQEKALLCTGRDFCGMCFRRVASEL